MLVVHGFFSPGHGLCLWAEDSGRAVKSRSQALRTARPHPFAAPAELLREWYSGEAGEATLLLPSLRSAPLDSPRLLRVTPRPRPRFEPVLLPWTVPTLTLGAGAVLHALAQQVPELRYGASVDHLAKIAEFAQDLAMRGQVLPSLERFEDGARARWRPVLQGQDVLTVHALSTSMPPVCRAVRGREDPSELVTAALDTLVDEVARERLAGVQLAPGRRGHRARVLSGLERWLEALSGPRGRFEADAGELDALAVALAPWEEIGRSGGGVARATFRLVEPPAIEGSAEPGSRPEAGTELGEPEQAPDLEPGPGLANGVTNGATRADPWRVEFLLQSVVDPSLLVPAAQVWADEGGLGRWLPRPQELLLAELARASHVYPDLAAGLRSSQPSVLELSADGAIEFLSTAAPALDQAGFGVLLPSWWDRRRGLGLKLSASTPVDGVVTTAGKFGKNQLMSFRWELALGQDVLTEEEIAALAATKAPLIRLRGQWVAVDAEQLKRGLAFLEHKPKRDKMSAAQILALAATHPDDTDTPLPVTGVHADGWLGELLDGSAGASIEQLAPPDGLRAELRPYQLRGLSWLAFLDSLGLGACLADDMGLGKTVQLLALEAVRRDREPDPRPSLLLCPMSLVGNWQREAAKFTPGLRVYAHHGRERLSGEALRERLTEVDLAITTYATATRDIDDLAGIEWQRVVLDEAQAIKNSLSQSAKAANRLTGSSRIALTGTPVENRLAELWSIMNFLNPGLLGSSELFRTRYAIPVERHGQAEPAERLRTITRPYVLRRVKTDPTIIDDLPEKVEVKEFCNLTTEQASLYQAIVNDMMERIEASEGIERRGNVLAAMTKLKQVCDHPALLLHDRSPIGTRSGKVNRLGQILEEILAEGDRVLCFTQYTEFAELLLPHLAARFDTDVAYLHGGTPKKRRDQIVTDFQSERGAPIFLLSLKAGGTGLNLTAANHVIHVDRWWNPAVENQATDRAFRIGQHRNVEVHKFVSTGTLEEKIDEMIEEKKALADLVVRDGEGWLTELSTHELRKLFALTAGAVDE